MCLLVNTKKRAEHAVCVWTLGHPPVMDAQTGFTEHVFRRFGARTSVLVPATSADPEEQRVAVIDKILYTDDP